MIRWNIAICDDEKVALELLGSSLRGALRTRNVDASIETFSRPRELLLRMQATSFDLLFLDIEMPGMTGLELAQRLRREGNLITFPTVKIWFSMPYAPIHGDSSAKIG